MEANAQDPRESDPHKGRGSILVAPRDDLSATRVRWLIRLRWIAMVGVLAAAGLSAAGFYPGANWPVLLGVSAAGVGYNLLLLFLGERTEGARRAAILQAVIDLWILTVVLWAAGGLRSPFVGFYVFHVAIVGILGGPRATLIAAAAAFLGSGLLLLVELAPALAIGRWDPIWPWDVFAEGMSFVTMVGAVAYLVTHAVRELRAREAALKEAWAREALEYELLSTTLNELDAGLEVVDEGGAILWRNRRAELLAEQSAKIQRSEPSGWVCPENRACEGDVHGKCPVRTALDQEESGRCRFAAKVDDEERVFEMQVFPLSQREGEGRRVMNLYLDRTASVVAERRLVLAERLASLGRVTQGVAHELNTPLATIRTLVADMRAALREVSEAGAERSSLAPLIADLSESSALVHDETRRLGRITQGLLTGRDLMREAAPGKVSIAAAVERARALVFAGVRSGIAVEVEPSVEGLEALVDADHLVQVLVNLLQNAHDAVRERREGEVRIRAHEDEAGIHLLVEDEGVGLPAEVRARLFEPFVTTKPPGKGTGLGLYTSSMLVSAMGGRLTLEPREHQGTRAELILPRARARAEEALIQLGRKPGPGAEEAAE